MQVIINADDFGRSAGVNAAISKACREGVLTSTSLMVAGDALGEAVALAKQMPGLAVGLHLVVVNGRAVLPARDIPHLVDKNGSFSNDPLWIGLRYFFSKSIQVELAREIEAQFERFAATGLQLSHVDGHLHMHMHPAVFNILLPLAEQYGARGLRIPRDDLWLGLGYDQHQAGLKLIWYIVFGLLSRWGIGRVKKYHLVAVHRVYGLMQSGKMQERYVVKLLRQLKEPTAELYFHPSTTDIGEPLGPNPGDLATLLSPKVQQVIRERNIQLADYPMLAKEGGN